MFWSSSNRCFSCVSLFTLSLSNCSIFCPNVQTLCLRASCRRQDTQIFASSNLSGMPYMSHSSHCFKSFIAMALAAIFSRLVSMILRVNVENLVLVGKYRFCIISLQIYWSGLKLLSNHLLNRSTCTQCQCQQTLVLFGTVAGFLVTGCQLLYQD